MTEITVITSSICHNCEQIKHILDDKGISYKTADIDDSDTLSDILLASYTGTSLPIIKINGKYYNSDSGLSILIGS